MSVSRLPASEVFIPANVSTQPGWRAIDLARILGAAAGNSRRTRRC